MSAVLASEDWVAELPSLAEEVRLSDFSGHVDVLITDAPGKVRFALEFVDGRLMQTEMGKPKGAPLNVEMKAKTLGALLREELDPAVAYMRGDVKLNDDYELALFRWRPTYRTDEWREFVAAVSEATVYSD